MNVITRVEFELAYNDSAVYHLKHNTTRTPLLKLETAAAIRMLYRNTKVKVRSPDGDTDNFDIAAGVLQGDILAPYLFIICLDYVLRTSIDKMKENGFKLTKERSRRYPAQRNYGRGLHRQHSASGRFTAQAGTLQHSLERATTGTAHKTEYMCFNQRGDISTLNSSSLKLLDKFTYLRISVSSIETDINTRLAKACTVIGQVWLPCDR